MKTLVTTIVLLIIAIVAFVGIFAWAPDRPVDQLTARWAQPPSTFVELQGMQVHLRDEGPTEDTGKLPIILLHGTSASLHTWQGWSELLQDQHRVVRFDLPGFGLTGPAPDADYSIDRYASFVVAMMDELGIEQAVLAGNSLGGQIAWETGLLAPDRIKGLVLVNAAGYPFTPESMPIGFRLAQIPALAPVVNRILPRSMIESSVRNVYGDPELVTDELVDLYYEITLREGNRAALTERFKHRLATDDAADRIRTLPQPTLIIWGGLDRLIPPESGHRFNEDIADSELAMFELLGHVPHEESPEMTVQMVESFLDRFDNPL